MESLSLEPSTEAAPTRVPSRARVCTPELALNTPVATEAKGRVATSGLLSTVKLALTPGAAPSEPSVFRA
jgi:hypothetical protein